MGIVGIDPKPAVRIAVLFPPCLSEPVSCRLSCMVDIDLLVEALRERGHSVEHVIPVPENAGVYELTIDGNALNLEEARALLEKDETK
jgi:hypothetical protein